MLPTPGAALHSTQGARAECESRQPPAERTALPTRPAGWRQRNAPRPAGASAMRRGRLLAPAQCAAAGWRQRNARRPTPPRPHLVYHAAAGHQRAVAVLVACAHTELQLVVDLEPLRRSGGTRDGRIVVGSTKMWDCGACAHRSILACRTVKCRVRSAALRLLGACAEAAFAAGAEVAPASTAEASEALTGATERAMASCCAALGPADALRPMDRALPAAVAA